MQIPISEAKTRLNELADIVAGGEEITLTVHGEPKVRIVPLEPTNDPTWEEIMKPVFEAAKELKPEDLDKTNPILEERRRRNNALRGLR